MGCSLRLLYSRMGIDEHSSASTAPLMESSMAMPPRYATAIQLSSAGRGCGLPPGRENRGLFMRCNLHESIEKMTLLCDHAIRLHSLVHSLCTDLLGMSMYDGRGLDMTVAARSLAVTQASKSQPFKARKPQSQGHSPKVPFSIAAHAPQSFFANTSFHLTCISTSEKAENRVCRIRPTTRPSVVAAVPSRPTARGSW